MSSARIVLILASCLLFAGCGGGGTSSSDSGSPGGNAAPPSGYLHLTTARLDQLRAESKTGSAAWTTLHQNVEDNLASTDPYDVGPENLATAYLMSGDSRYAARAYWWVQQSMAQDLSQDSYYNYGELLEGAALTLNYCAPALTQAQAKILADYLDASADELWNHNKGSGWGLDNPRNNYHHNFIMGTAYAGYALKAAGDARGDKWIAKVKDLLEKPGGVRDYLDHGVPGGDWEEGVNYAEGSKSHLGRALSLIAAAGGTNHFNASPFFRGVCRFDLYATQPGGHFIYPGGDLARESSMAVSPYDRGLLQPMLAWMADSPERRLGQWYLDHVVPTYLDGDHSFNWRTGLYLDELFGAALPETDPSGQALGYRTPVTGWINLRSGWDDAAGSLTISGDPRVVESHQHMDTGSFTFWKGGWQAADASTYSPSGELMGAEAHNLLRVPHAQWLTDEAVQVPGLRRYADYGSFAYAQVDCTRLYRWAVSSSDIRDLLSEHTREFVYVRPGTLVLFDRVKANPDGVGYAWCLHAPEAPAPVAGGYVSAHEGGGLAVARLLGGTVSVVSDADLEAGTTSYRLDEAAPGTTSRFLHVLEVDGPATPAVTGQLLASSAGVRAVLVHQTVVVFSDGAFAAPAALPFTYTVPGTVAHAHVLCNLSGTVKVTTSVSGGQTVVTVSAGAGVTPDTNGVATLSLP